MAGLIDIVPLINALESRWLQEGSSCRVTLSLSDDIAWKSLQMCAGCVVINRDPTLIWGTKHPEARQMKAGTAWLVAFQCPLRRLSSYGKADLQRCWRSSWNQKRLQRADCWLGDAVTSNLRCSQLFKKSGCDQDKEKKRAAALKGQPVSRTRIKPVPGESGMDYRGEQCSQWWTSRPDWLF